MLGGMQDWELRVSGLIDHAAREHGQREIVTRWANGSETRSNWAETRHRAMQMAQALWRIGLKPHDRVGTLAMNHAHHLVAWYGATGAGGVVHTINPRLFDDQIEYIVNHAEDRVLVYDAMFRPIVERLKPRLTTVEKFICFDDGEFLDWIGSEDGAAEWARGVERDPCMLCYTSGTTGNPKGVLMEHRSNILHTLMGVAPQALALESRSVVLPVVPMFHANNWGLPWACAAVGAKLLYSQVNEPQVLFDLLRTENSTHLAGVPTVYFAMLQYLDATGGEMPPIRHAISGGSALPPAIIERLMRAGIRVGHAWGMTETSPVASIAYETADWDDLSFDEQVRIKSLQGRVPYGTEVRAVDLDDRNKVLPRDGRTAGALQVRGQWVIKRYFKAAEDAVCDGQWFDTGDVALIHPDGSVQLTDRTKDVIKSGGEWISSVELENAAVAHPGVAEAAAIGIAHPKWDERPILIVVRKPDAELDAEEMRTFLSDKVAKWWLPDAVEFVEGIPHTGTGKISKKDLREQFADYRLPS
ncbi:long-chain fatty acid--CoA ligase [Novosphingobium marinum]|uniref:3-methylmercaptopropionyl-CoA ligase n=1 Tax=Novosphingobium marinum TaxID=1514948 RepID=A0A7Y9XT11_9SPHN|nr:long-chain fatty acid--CoA ligase [Novosphingobium marinum]NYH93942.1 fatty-acyl-CoA synthase [Novosphingobium marinum]